MPVTNQEKEKPRRSRGTNVVIIVLFYCMIGRFLMTYSPSKLLDLTQNPLDSVYDASPTVQASSLATDETVVGSDSSSLAPTEEDDSSSDSSSLAPTEETNSELTTLSKTDEGIGVALGSTTTTSSSSEPSIRRWGCHNTETPMIFVHLGKAGGGEIRARLAGAAENYSRDKWHVPGADQHFYPVAMNSNGNSTDHRKAKFCNSQNANHAKIPENNFTTPLHNRTKSFEGDKFCNSTTPFGVSIACPTNYRTSNRDLYRSQLCLGCDDDYYLETLYYKNSRKDSKMQEHMANLVNPPIPGNMQEALDNLVNPPNPGHTCDTVYVSHNYLGGELNWLPPRYLKEHWWDNSDWKAKSESNPLVNDRLEGYWNSLLSDRQPRAKKVLQYFNDDKLNAAYAASHKNETDVENDTSKQWCPSGYIGIGDSQITHHRPIRSTSNWKQNKDRYEHCTKPIGEATDTLFREFWSNHPQGARLHNTHMQNLKQGDGVQLAHGDNNNYSPVYASLPLHRVTMIREPFSWLLSKFFWHNLHSKHQTCDDVYSLHPNSHTLSWVEQYSLEYIIYLCGYECQIRYENHMVGIETLEAQAADNLRNAFSVVGLLHDNDAFYDMIHQRIAYVDLKKTSAAQGGRHSSGNSKEKQRCVQVFQNETFRQEVRDNLPIFAALERVYQVGEKVHEFQKEELAQCSSSSDGA